MPAELSICDFTRQRLDLADCQDVLCIFKVTNVIEKGLKLTRWIKEKKPFQTQLLWKPCGLEKAWQEPALRPTETCTPLGHYNFGTVFFEGKDEAFEMTSHRGAKDLALSSEFKWSPWKMMGDSSQNKPAFFTLINSALKFYVSD